MVKAGMAGMKRTALITAAILLASCSEQPVSAQQAELDNAPLGAEPTELGGQDISNAELESQHERLAQELTEIRRELPEKDGSGPGFMAWLMGLAGFGLGVILMGALRFFGIGAKKDSDSGRRNAGPAAGYDETLANLKEYQRVKFDKISQELVDIDMKITRLGKTSSPATASQRTAASPPQASPTSMPKAAPTPSAAAKPASPKPAAYEAVDTSRPAAPPQAAGPAPISANMVRDITQAFNGINSSASLADFESVYEPASFSNMRDQGIDQIFENEIARFWLVVDPENENRALLLPGADAIKNWAKYKDRKLDNPFGHHFALRQGEDLRLVQPALLMKSAEGWQVQNQGVLSGMQ